jgi:hypothetical protein
VLSREALHRHREDVPGAALRLVSRLALDLLQPERGLVACLLLDVGDEELLRLRGAQARDPLELAALHPLGAFELLGLLLDVSLAVLERARAPLDVCPPHLQGLGLPQRPLLHPRDLRAAGLKLIARSPAAWPLAPIVCRGSPPPRLKERAYLHRHLPSALKLPNWSCCRSDALMTRP